MDKFVNRYTPNELKELAKERGCVNIEYYVTKNGRISYHTDEIKEIDIEEYFDALGQKYDCNKKLKCDYEVMDRECYEYSILANSSLFFSDIYNDDDKVLVVLLPKKQ